MISDIKACFCYCTFKWVSFSESASKIWDLAFTTHLEANKSRSGNPSLKKLSRCSWTKKLLGGKKTMTNFGQFKIKPGPSSRNSLNEKKVNKAENVFFQGSVRKNCIGKNSVITNNIVTQRDN